MIRGTQNTSSPDPKLIQIQLSFSAGKSSFHFSHGLATRPSNAGQRERGRDVEKTIRGHEQATGMGKIILKLPSWQ